MVELGYNYRLTDIGAALGSSPARAAGRVPGAPPRARRALPRPASRDGRTSTCRSSTPARIPRGTSTFVQLRLDRLSVDRGAVYQALRAEGIGVNVHYIPVHRHPYYRRGYPGRRRARSPRRAYERLLTLPLHAGMTTADVDDVVAALDKVLGAYALAG